MTNTPSSFTLRLADASDFPSPRLRSLEARISTGPDFHDAFELVEEGIGPKIPQGSLFAYLFRRFGFPNAGSDPHKDLASYRLTTSHPDMLMRITPYTGGDTHLSFAFLVDGRLAEELQRWPYRERDAHEAAFPEWLVNNGLLPDWMPEQQREAAAGGYAPPNQPMASIPQVLMMIGMKAWTLKNSGGTDHRVDWHHDMRARYEKEHPAPVPEYRSEDWQDWSDEDPMKPYAKAIIETLTELTRPVWVRDVPIDPWGRMDDDDAADRIEALGGSLEDDDPSPVADAAGYPSGALANKDPQGHAELMAMVLRLGEDDIEAGFARAQSLLAPALEDGASES